MSDADLAQQAEDHFKRTTIKVSDWAHKVKTGVYNPPDGSTTEWGKGFAALDKIKGVAPTPSALGSGAGTFRSAGSYSDYVSPTMLADLGKMQFLISDINALRAPKDLPNVFHYLYRSVCTGVDFASLPNSTIINNGWALKDASGNYVKNAGYGGYALDISNKDCSNALAQEAIQLCQQNGYKGFFGDDCNRAMTAFVDVIPVGWDQKKWHQSLVQHVGIIAQAAKNAGLKFYVNESTWRDGGTVTDDMNFITELASVGVSGIEREFWMQYINGNSFTPMYGGDFTDWRKLHPLCNSLGIDFIAASYAALDSQAAMYYKACHLLDREREGSFLISAPSNYPPNGNTAAGAWSKDEGDAKGAATGSGNNWSRAFANGTVTVDAGSCVGTIS
jgi:hypothetical protein